MQDNRFSASISYFPNKSVFSQVSKTSVFLIFAELDVLCLPAFPTMTCDDDPLSSRLQQEMHTHDGCRDQPSFQRRMRGSTVVVPSGTIVFLAEFIFRFDHALNIDLSS